MAINLVSIRCPDCGAALDVEEGRKQLFCSYCGAKVLVDNENEQIIRHVDEAEIKKAESNQAVQLKRAEVDEAVKLKKLEIIERRRAEKAKAKKTKIVISIILGAIGLLSLLTGSDTGMMVGLFAFIILMYIWIFSNLNSDKEEEDLDLDDKVKVPSGISDYEHMNYATIEALFNNAGFHNVKSIPLNDLTLGVLKRPGMVSSITINGKEISSGGRKYSPDATVIISYHSHR